MQAMVQYFWDHRQDVYFMTQEHIAMTGMALGLALAISIPLGILAARVPRLSFIVTWLGGLGQTIPSLALLGLMMPYLGIGTRLAIAALTIRALLPILINTFVGIKGVAPSAIQAGIGMGMTSAQRLFMVELPLAAPTIAAGVRTAAVHCISIATLAALVGAGGLGDYILQGVAQAKTEQMLTGIVPAVLLAIVADQALGGVERLLTPRGLRTS